MQLPFASIPILLAEKEKNFFNLAQILGPPIPSFCFVDQEEGADYWAIFDPELYRALYESYTSVRPFSQYELEHLDDALKYVGLTQPVWAMTVWEQYHPGQQMVETNLYYWKCGLDKLTLPVL